MGRPPIYALGGMATGIGHNYRLVSVINEKIFIMRMKGNKRVS
jgi:hypothetical protein